MSTLVLRNVKYFLKASWSSCTTLFLILLEFDKDYDSHNNSLFVICNSKHITVYLDFSFIMIWIIFSFIRNVIWMGNNIIIGDLVYFLWSWFLLTASHFVDIVNCREKTWHFISVLIGNNLFYLCYIRYSFRNMKIKFSFTSRERLIRTIRWS